ncbi:phage coat protein [Vibrio parahaemolyticus]|uniref:Major capsid protein n=1 Tax=Vibrio phage vB_VpI_FR1 TaxID=2995280 RepID=A0A9E8S5F0_9VIRU|nr:MULTISPECIES: phage coat protein [Vibrio harveyi group]WAB24948.1 major capsid protein [Vibrio phage vB_VpI_FR1]EGQ7867307.1 phage coat protein [Vibrio parahaemolyticus]EGQ7885942.1 phage coat protein [Vibrio parahaemolyticus]EGQ9373573.1 phage coat protein [Vibrio parahaemolyticus]EGQ9421192.1 phage coat protein [Vibrio parahaemolyticus]
MKYINKAKKFAKRGAATMAVAALSLPAFAEGGAADPFSAIDLSGVAVKIGAAGLLIVGITMAYKSITLAKRAVNKA